MHDEENIFFQEPVTLPIEDGLDLHAFAPRAIPDLLEEYLAQCHKAGLREVRIIHGKGTGAQRRKVHACLERNPLIERFYQAPAEAGGWGATIAVLRAAGQEQP
jgi:dsDNA-specific endonuclease/ATPase MutS2